MRVGKFTVPLILVLSSAIAGQQSDIWKSLANQPEWRFTDPAYLYLVIRQRETRGDSVTFLHPTQHRSNWCEESFMPAERQKARETPEGYEVTFQAVDPIEPWIERPLAGKEFRVFFPRSERKLVKLTDKMSIQGFYGSPEFKRP